MLFSSVSFIYLFLPAVMLLYFASPRKIKNAVLLFSSLAFYFMGEPVYILLLLFSSVSDFVHGLIIDKLRGRRGAKIALVSAIVINLLMLGFFKYADFFISLVNSALGTQIPLLNIPLPIGISFFTFQTMSYSIDVFRGDTAPSKNLLNFGAYVTLFPQLIAGPIVRYRTVAAELENRKSTISDVSSGMLRFSVGLGKKVLIANMLGEFCSAFRNASEPSTLFYWVYAVAYCLQIYFDFSGYSDMAIGMGRMFGFNFPENFNYPFISKSLSEFWRRWHITLGTWFRDYVYFPLGGSRVGKIKLLRNLFVVWLLTGLWHGAAVNFVLWGLSFFVLLSIEKLFLGKYLQKAPVALQIAYTIFFTLVTFVIFGSADGGTISGDLSGFFGLANLPFVSGETLYYVKSFAPVIIFAAIGATPLPKKIFSRYSALEPIFIAAVIILSTACLVNGSFNPFLYFRF